MIDLPPDLVVRCLVLTGSHAFGLAGPGSDEDWRGVYQAPTDAFLGLQPPPQAIERKPDTTYWELGHYCRLLLKGNPNILETIWIPAGNVKMTSPVMEAFRGLRESLLTRPMAYAYIGWIKTEMRHPIDVLNPKRLSHVIRLLYELRHAEEERRLVVRLEDEERDRVLAIKTWGARRWVELVDDVAHECNRLLPLLIAGAERMGEPPVAVVEKILLTARHGEYD